MRGRHRTVAGWYPDQTTGGLRYWDGSRWTRDKRPAQPTVVVNVASQPSSDAATVAQINALANPETAKALLNLRDLRNAEVLTDADFRAAKATLLGSPAGGTRAGWYDDGSGRLRWWDGQQWTDHVRAAGNQSGGSSSHLGWALSPAYTFGVVAFIPALHAALKLQRRDLWCWAAALTGGNVLAWILMSVGDSDPDQSTPVESLGAFLCLLLAVAGTVQALRTRDQVFSPSRGPARPAVEPDPAVASSLAARRRREESVRLSVKDPSLARDLMIGRPDLNRQYDDGGLVDVNHVPEAILVSHLGLSDEQARAVIEAREHIGGFSSPNDLCVTADLPPRIFDAIRDRVVTL